MSVSRDIVATWRSPRRVIRRQLEAGRREDRALVYLMLACGLIFVAQWPRLSRQAFFDDTVPLNALLGGALLGWLFLAPLAAYGLAALAHLLARLAGGRGTWFSARMALFWALLASSPAWLFHGLVAGFIGPGPAETAVGAVLSVVVLGFWLAGMFEAEREPEAVG